MSKPLITAERLREVLRYEPLTGLLHWRVRLSNRITVGDAAGTQHRFLYMQIRVDGRIYKSHRLAWLYMTGEWPTQMIDHINGNRSDNRWSNLRDVSRSVNQQNLRAPPGHNTSGFLGVSKRNGGWIAQIKLNGKGKHLGQFTDKRAAHEAYIAAKRRMHEGNTL